MAQTRTSKETSINNVKLPAIYNKVDFSHYESVLDYGCGAYIDHLIQKVKDIQWIGYDPFNLPGSQKAYADLVICSNVLNVIDDDETMINVIHDLFNLGHNVIISIYEGPDKILVDNGKGKMVKRPSCIGRETKPDCWQRNEPISKYLDLITSLGYKAHIKYGFIFGTGKFNKAA